LPLSSFGVFGGLAVHFLARRRTQDGVDASVVVLSIRRGADIVSAEVKDISRLLSAARAKTAMLDVSRCCSTRATAMTPPLGQLPVTAD